MGIKAAVMIHGEKMEKSVGQTKHKIENKADVVKLFSFNLTISKAVLHFIIKKAEFLFNCTGACK